MEKNKLKLAVLLLFIVLNLNGQATELSYDIITKIISQDTVPDEYFPRVLHMKIIRGKISKEDSVKSMLRFRKNPLLLIRKASNKFAKEKLTKQYLDTTKLAKYLGRELLLEIIEKIPPNRNHPDELSTNKITVVSEKPKYKTHHYFSTPFLIEKGKFIIYHFKTVARGVGKSEFILYCVKPDDSIEIDKTFILWEHGVL